ncbi:ATP-dependent zinc metalloprotease FtsH [Myxosarcina sp. GI1(2024)]
MPVEMDRDRPTPPSRQVGSSLLSLLLFLLFFNLFILPFIRSSPKEVLYSQFLQQLQDGKVARALVEPNEIRYTLKSTDAKSSNNQTASTSRDNQPVYVTTPIASDRVDVVQLLEKNQVEFGAPPPDRLGWLTTILGWVAPPLIFVAIWAWFLKKAAGNAPSALTVGKSKARIYAEGKTGVTFQDVAGVDEAKVELAEIVEFLKHSEKYSNIGAVIPKGVLLVGPPGTGKTLLARAIAGEASVPFFSISGSEFIELFVGVGAARVRDLFQQAKQQAPCIVFIDELDALGKARRSNISFGGNDEQEQTLNQLLTEMDGFEANTGVIIIAATNRPEVLDPALRRPGRFDRQVLVDRPDRQGREAILKVHAQKVQLDHDVDFGAIAIRTPGFAGADLANLVNEAALLAARRNSPKVTTADFNEAIERVIAGLERKSRVLNQIEKTTVAYHEVGHAIVGSLMPGASRVEKISIIPRGVGALGYTLQLPEEDRFLMMEDEIRGRIATLLGGRTAEEVVFDKVSTGASDDLQKVTDLAERMVTLYGMDEQLGLVVFEKTQQQFIDGYASSRRPTSPQIADLIDRQVKQIVDEAHQIARHILEVNSSLLEEMAQYLLQHEVLEGQTLKQYLQKAQAPDELNDWLSRGNQDKLTI